ncbi:MAG: RNA helicase, partial [Alphaproteobacteria bacterium]|nr:RNA helicase [Alphaproteobacteria bacterium]
APAADAGPARRTRSRRGGRSARPTVETAVEAVDQSPAETPVETPAETAAVIEPAPQARPARETHLRQSDRRGDRAEAEPQPTNGRPFGESEVPAFLRRPVPVRG